MNTDKTIDVEDLQEFLPDEKSSLTFTAANAAEAEDPIQNFTPSTPKDHAEGDDASAHGEVLSAISFGDVASNEKPFDSGGNDDEERSNEVEGIIRRIYSDETTITQSTSARDFTERTLPEDTFSFLIYTDVFSSCFLLGIMVFLFQTSIYAVLLFDIIVSGSENNRFNFPINVDKPVRIAEVLAILISIITQQDVRKAIYLYRDGFDESGLTLVFKGATLSKWCVSIVLRASEGLMGLFITFLLIMRSPSVLDLLLNFSAIEFVTMLDDVLFELASEGFLGRKLKKETKRLSSKSYYVSHEHANSYSAMIVSIAYFVVLFTAFFAGWVVILIKQKNGSYVCQLIFSQFGSEALPMLGTFTGLFDRHSKMFDGRSSYRGTGITDTGMVPLLAYCENKTRWTLSLTQHGEDCKKWNPCNDWLAASSEIESIDYNILSAISTPWIINTPSKGGAPFTNPFMACYECKNGDNFCGDHGECSPDGEPKPCSCYGGYFGLRCEYIQPCQVLEVSQRDGNFPKGVSGYFASKYYRLNGADAYYRPVYTSLVDESLNNDISLGVGGNKSPSDDFDVIVFTGDRWIMSYKSLFGDLKDVKDTEELENYFNKEFHGHFTNYSAIYESEPVIIFKQSEQVLDADAKAEASPSPLSLRWRSSSEGDFVKSKLYCTKCNDQTNPCIRGTCATNGTCICTREYSGSRCEIPPQHLSNGHCDPEFNTEEFNFDGGDCCEDTCRSTLDNICGKTERGFIDIGYPSCRRRDFDQWYLSGDAINGVSSVSKSGYVVALGGRGTILAVADPGASTVRLFDKDGADWRQRGPVIIGPFNSHFGSAISLSSIESNHITRNPLTSPKVILAVGAPKIGLVRVFSCSTDGCIKGNDIIRSGRFGSSISVDGYSIAIGEAAKETIISDLMITKHEVRVFTWANGAWEERGSVNFTTSQLRKLSNSSDQSRLEGYYVSLSGDYLAVGTLEGTVSPGPSPSFESVKLITQVFQQNNTEWEQLGKRIVKDFFDDKAFDTPWPLKAVAMKGSVLAIGYKTSADVYSWDESSNAWSKREIALATGPEDFVGWSVDLSDDADILAIGTSISNPQPTDKSIRMYQWDGNSYKVQSNGIPGGPAASLSLSSDGKAVAVGLPLDSSNGGSTRVYNFYQASPCDDTSEKSLRISFTTDGKSEETTWELQVDSEVKRSGSLSGHAYTTFVEEICVPDESSVMLFVNDTERGWLEFPGVFAVMSEANNLVQESQFGSYIIFQPPTPKPTAVTQPPTPKPTVVTQPPTPKPTAVFQPPTPTPTAVTQCPTPSQLEKCEDGSDLVWINVTLARGKQPSNSYWDLIEQSGMKTIIVDVRYDVKEQSIVREVCKPRSDCYIFRLSTTGASALVCLDGKEIAMPEWEVKIGDSCL